MDRKELGKQLNMFEEYVPIYKKNRPGTKIQPTSITIHNTSNSGKGADADAHSKFIRNTGYYIHKGKRRWISWHYTVDDAKVIKQIPINEVTWHAGSTANATSISIETCMHKGINQYGANMRLAKLVSALIYDLRLSINDIHPHKKWTGKNCPILLLEEWEEFIQVVSDILGNLRSVEVAGYLTGDDVEFDFSFVGTAGDVEDFEIDHDALTAEINK